MKEWSEFINPKFSINYFAYLLEKPELKKSSEIFWIFNYISETHQEDAAEIMENANLLLQKTFVFKKQWDMEPNKTPYTFVDKINWKENPFNDIEWTFMLNRHRYLIDLLSAYYLHNRDLKYLLAFKEIIVDYIANEKNCFGNEQTTWRSLDAGMRLSNWIDFLEIIRFHPDVFDEEFMYLFFDGITRHVAYLLDNYDKANILSNWGVFQNHALIKFASLFPEHLLAEKIINCVGKRLLANIDSQILNDGIHWEQSPMYHNDVLSCFLEIVHLVNLQLFAMPQKYISLIKKMGLASLKFAMPNGYQPTQGDSDYNDMRDIVQQASFVFGLPNIPGIFKSPQSTSIIKYGEKIVAYLELVLPKENLYLDNFFPDSGNFFAKTGWKSTDIYWRCNNGPFGSGHGHADNFNFCLYANNEQILIDGGRYSYADKEKRMNLRSPKAHNTFIVDAINFSSISSSWSQRDVAIPVNNFYRKDRFIKFISASHNGYIQKTPAALVTRQIISIKDRFWFINDYVETSKKFTIKQFFNFSEFGKITNDDNCITYTSKLNRLCLYNLAESKITIEPILYSSQYNCLESGKRIILNNDNAILNNFVNFIALNDDIENTFMIKKLTIQDLDDKIIDDKKALAYKMSNNDLTIIVVFNNGYLPRLNIEGLWYSGHVIVNFTQNSKDEIFVLQN